MRKLDERSEINYPNGEYHMTRSQTPFHSKHSLLQRIQNGIWFIAIEKHKYFIHNFLSELFLKYKSKIELRKIKNFSFDLTYVDNGNHIWVLDCLNLDLSRVKQGWCMAWQL